MKLLNVEGCILIPPQPPSGGCVLKQHNRHTSGFEDFPAAFRRLCVETIITYVGFDALMSQPPSGGCVLKPSCKRKTLCCWAQPPSGGCVLKQKMDRRHTTGIKPSRLQAAVC